MFVEGMIIILRSDIYLTMGKLFSFSGPPFPHLCTENTDTYTSQGGYTD